MDLAETLLTGADVTELYDFVSDLGNYPDWLGLVARVDPEPEPTRDPRGSWIVELRGRIGPFARSKRLRMVRTEAVRPDRVRYERVEIDDREHAPWQLTAQIEATDGGARLSMRLHYGGTRFAPVLEPILREEIRKGRRLLSERYPSRR